MSLLNTILVNTCHDGKVLLMYQLAIVYPPHHDKMAEL